MSKYTFESGGCEPDCCDYHWLKIFKDGKKIQEFGHYGDEYVLQQKEITEYLKQIGIYDKIIEEDPDFERYFSIWDLDEVEV